MNAGEDNPDSGSDEEVVRYRWDEFESPTLATVRAVAAATNREPTELPPLYETADPEALDTIFSGHTVHPQRDDSPTSDTEFTSSGENLTARVEFSYAGVRVVIRNDGVLEVRSDGSRFE